MVSKKINDQNVKLTKYDISNTACHKIDERVDYLNSKINLLNNETYFIGNSIGGQTILRYLETKEITKIGGILLVTPRLDLLPEAIEEKDSYNTAQFLINARINFEKVKQFTNNISCIFSDNDVSLEQEKEFRNKLNVKTIIVNNKDVKGQE